VELRPYLYKTRPRLEQTGDHLSLADVYALEGFDKGPRSFKTAAGIAFAIELTNVGNGTIVVSGSAATELESICDRCLDALRIPLEYEVDGVAVLDASALDAEAMDEGYMAAAGPEGVIDLAGMLFSCLMLAIPAVILCRQDCAGLCSGCGANLNDEPCSCQGGDGVGASDDAAPKNPFSALRGLFDGGEAPTA
jgi:uncharacterized protein